MTMAYQVTTKLPYTTGIPRDVAETTWSFVGPDDADETMAFDLFDILTDEFWKWSSSAVTTVSTYLSTIVDRTACTHEFRLITDLSTGETSAPFTQGWTPNSADVSGTFNLPLEVALVNSIYANRITGIDIRSTRGRQYIGPFVGAAAGLSDTAYPLCATALRTTLAEAAQNLNDSLVLDGTFQWAIWSRKEADMYPVAGGWVDNEWDTQRRREVPGTARSMWNV